MNRGLSLVEMAIIVTIIALIVGGILNGKNLIHTSQLQSVVADVNKFKSAVNTFTVKYNALPGDIPNATSFWTPYAGCYPPTGVTFYSVSTNQTCNGNGNGYVDYNVGAYGEEYLFWQHLALAGLIQGTYDGGVALLYVNGSPSNTPSLPLSNLAYSYYRFSYQTNVYGFNSNMFSINAYENVYSLANGPVMSPTDAQSIDQKADDGVPNTGTIMGYNVQGEQTNTGEAAALGLSGTCVTTDYTAYVAGTTTENYCTPGTTCAPANPNTILCKLFFMYP